MSKKKKELKIKEMDLVCPICSDIKDPNPTKTLVKTGEDLNKSFYKCPNCKYHFSFDGETCRNLGIVAYGNEPVKAYNRPQK